MHNAQPIIPPGLHEKPHRSVNSAVGALEISMHLLSSIWLCLLLFGCANTPRDRTVTGTLPVYGNWCGPGHPRNGGNPLPIDAVDGACRKHDNCYAQKKYFACECDNDLLLDLAKIKNDKWKGRKQVSGDEYFEFENSTVRAIRAYFAATACSPSRPADVVAAVPLKTVTALDVGTDTTARATTSVIVPLYSIIITPFLWAAKGICAIADVPSCANVQH